MRKLIGRTCKSFPEVTHLEQKSWGSYSHILTFLALLSASRSSWLYSFIYKVVRIGSFPILSGGTLRILGYYLVTS